MVVGLCGSFVRKCYRCRSTQHLVKDFPEPDTRTRDIEQASASVEDPDAALWRGLDLNDLLIRSCTLLEFPSGMKTSRSGPPVPR